MVVCLSAKSRLTGLVGRSGYANKRDCVSEFGAQRLIALQDVL